MLVSWGPVLVLFALAFMPTLIAMVRTLHPGWLLHLGILHYAILSLIFFGYARYRTVVEPLCLILAAESLAFCLAQLEVYRRRTGGTGPSRAATPDGALVGYRATAEHEQLRIDLPPARIEEGLRP
jgi:hypothetical protein